MSIDPKTLEVAAAVARMLAPVVADLTQNVVTLDYGIPEGRYTITVAPVADWRVGTSIRNTVRPSLPPEPYDLGDELDNGDGPGGYFYDHMLDR
jgi:hypothetical protein